jgi:hypothetical protein
MTESSQHRERAARRATLGTDNQAPEGWAVEITKSDLGEVVVPRDLSSVIAL